MNVRSCLAFCCVIAVVSPCFADDAALRQLIAEHGLQPLTAPDSESPAMVKLGQSLFFDRELSGNRNVSCATCHHPGASSADARALPSGVGGEGLGPDRTQQPDREVVPRNAPEVFHRSNSGWTSMFWDSRIAGKDGQFTSPAGEQLPAGLETPLEMQAMFPVTSRAEMRGNQGDVDINGKINEIAQVADGDFQGIWQALTDRLKAIPAYQQAFQEAFPEVPDDQIGFQHAAKAIAAFESQTFSPNDSAWDRYLAGDDLALSAAAKRGASHFYSGNCATCHSGDLFTNQEHHNIGVPQLGPGKDASHLDIGRALETNDSDDNFKFRTPPLRNVAITGPWMHNGSYSNLEDVVRHKYDPTQSLADYDVSQLPDHLQPTVKLDEATLNALLETLDPELPIGEALTDDIVNDLMAFLGALTSPSVDLMIQTTPASVLSGLEVETLPPSEIELLYDPETGALSLHGNEQLELDALFLRISDDPGGDAAEFTFATEVAPWADDKDIVLSDLPDAQSFLDFRTNPMQLFAAGDTIPSLLPSGIRSTEILDHLSAAYRVHGSPLLWSANVFSVPEPGTGVWRWLAPGLLLTLRRTKRRRREGP